MADKFDDTVTLKLDGDAVPIVSNYQVDAGVMEVPAAFSMTVGHAGNVGAIAAAYPGLTPFELFVGETKVQTGQTDGYSLVGGMGSEVTIHGRDMLRWLVDTQLESERTFSEKTFKQLTEIALADVGLTGLVTEDDTVNLKAITGVQTVKQAGPDTFFNTVTGATEAAPEAARAGTTQTTHKSIKVKVGTTWFDFIVNQLRRAGLFIWAAVDGSFILSKPNGLRPAIYRIIRRRGTLDEPGAVNVLGQPTFSSDITKRYTECHVFGRAGGGKAGRGKVTARHYDEEMIALYNPDPADRANGGKRRKPEIIEDDKVKTIAQAAFLARRKVAESRRAGWSLSYTVRGHSAPALGGGRAIWQPNTVVEVVDDELGVEGPMWVESVVYRRKPETTTEIKLLRIEDLIFAEEDVAAQKAGKRPGLQKGRPGIANPAKPGETHVIWLRNPQWGNLPTAELRPGPPPLTPAQLAATGQTKPRNPFD